MRQDFTAATHREVEMTSVGEDAGKRDTWAPLTGMQDGEQLGGSSG